MVDQGHQVLVRCGGEVGTVGVIYLPQDTISSLKDRLVSGSARPASAQTSLLVWLLSLEILYHGVQSPVV